jgi:tRNA modification GTPase
MRAPHSYTGEHVAEIYCHGGFLLLERVLHEVLRTGARIAEPGEFTKRAFLNNRIDLTQAEAICDMILAKTEKALNLALCQLKGNLLHRVENWQNILIDQLALLEASIEFSEDTAHVGPAELSVHAIRTVHEEILAASASYHEGRIYRQGASVVIAGKPNVGKSSLLNRMLGEQRVIVTPIPGTTRDLIDEFVNIRGIPVRLTDTAGIRPTGDVIEKEGIRRVWERIVDADAVVVLLDGSDSITGEDLEIMEKIDPNRIIIAVNKSDLPCTFSDEELRARIHDVTPLKISAKYGQGISDLNEAIRERILHKNIGSGSETMITNVRHRLALDRCATAIQSALDRVERKISPELVVFELQEAVKSLGEISGNTVTDEETLDRIFSNFCIGK